MQIDLDCPRCAFHYGAAAATLADEIVGEMVNEGPWLALGEGHTFEDMVRAALAVRGRICCPDCHTALAVHVTRLVLSAHDLCACA